MDDAVGVVYQTHSDVLGNSCLVAARYKGNAQRMGAGSFANAVEFFVEAGVVVSCERLNCDVLLSEESPQVFGERWSQWH